jgi:hypothetical protein
VIRFRDIEANPDGYSEPLQDLAGWVRKFICRCNARQGVVGRRVDPHGVVGQAEFDAKSRRAHVCPFVADSIDRDLFWMAESDLGLNQTAQIEALLRDQIATFMAAVPAYDPYAAGAPASGDTMLKTFFTALPRLKHAEGSSEAIEGIFQTLKPEFMGAGLMLGQFYHGCPQPGAHNPKFQPLWTPWPAFAVRYMVKEDHLFTNALTREFYEHYFGR